MKILVSPSKTQNPSAPDALHLFTGEVFKQLKLSSYTPDQLDYLNRNLIILSDKYGYILPSQVIKPHRPILTTSKIKKFKPRISKFLNSFQEPILNLSSKEYSKLLPVQSNIFNINFPAMPSVYLKKTRGKILNYCVLNNIVDPNTLNFATLISNARSL